MCFLPWFSWKWEPQRSAEQRSELSLFNFLLSAMLWNLEMKQKQNPTQTFWRLSRKNRRTLVPADVCTTGLISIKPREGKSLPATVTLWWQKSQFLVPSNCKPTQRQWMQEFDHHEKPWKFGKYWPESSSSSSWVCQEYLASCLPQGSGRRVFECESWSRCESNLQVAKMEKTKLFAPIYSRNSFNRPL